MNNFVLEPTHENLERYKRVQGEETYWHTADFFLFDPNIKNELSIIFDSYMDALMESDEEDEDEASRKIAFSLGRMIVKAAREIGVSPKDFRDQFNNYATVIWTPICIWRKDNLGEISYSLMSGLQCSSKKNITPFLKQKIAIAYIINLSRAIALVVIALVVIALVVEVIAS